MSNGRFNIMLGIAALFVAAFIGFALGQSLEPYYKSGYGQIPLFRYLTKAGHTHGMLIGLVNIVFGLLISRAECSDKLKRTCAILTALALCVPIGVALRGLTEDAKFAELIAMTGGFSFLGACITMMIIVRSTRSN